MNLPTPTYYDPTVTFPSAQFTRDWTTKLTQVFEKFILRDDDGQPRRFDRVLEIGCYEGRTTCYLAERALNHDGGRIVCVDPFDYEPARRFTGETDYRTRASHDVWGDAFKEVEKRFRHNFAIVEGYLREQSESKFVCQAWAVRQCSRGYLAEVMLRDDPRFDLILVDGSHLLADVTLDLFLSMHVVKEGTFIVVDDFPKIGVIGSGQGRESSGPIPQTKEQEEVFAACQHFKRAFKNRLSVVWYDEPAAVFKVTK